jgi:hypothetical protein
MASFVLGLLLASARLADDTNDTNASGGAAGAPETATPPAPGAVVQAVPPSPDRWPLMMALQGTWEGSLLDGARTQISGWFESSFTAGTDGRNQLPLSFNYLADEPVLQQAWLRIEQAVVTTGTTEPTFGYRTDWLLGTDYRFTLPRGIFNQQLTAHDGQPATYGIDPVAFYVEAYVPTIASGLDLKIGRFFAPFGIESIEAVSNPLLSHSYTFTNGPPFTNTGLLATLTVTPVWQVQAGLVLGSDIFINPADEATAIVSVQWTQPGNQNIVKWTSLFDSGRYNVARQQNNFNDLDIVWQHVLAAGVGGASTPRISYNAELLMGYETGLPDETTLNGQLVHIGTATFAGLANYLNIALSPRLVTTVRLEAFDDPQGTRTDTAPGATPADSKGLYTAATLGLTFKPTREIMIQPEVRGDYNGESRPFDGQHGLLTVGVGVTLRY